MDRASLLSMADRIATRSTDPELYTLLHALIDHTHPGDFMANVRPDFVVAPEPEPIHLVPSGL